MNAAYHVKSLDETNNLSYGEWQQYRKLEIGISKTLLPLEEFPF